MCRGAYGLSNLVAAGESTHDFLRRFAQTAPDLVVIDPPRAGVDPGTLKLRAALGPTRASGMFLIGLSNAFRPPMFVLCLPYVR